MRIGQVAISAARRLPGVSISWAPVMTRTAETATRTPRPTSSHIQ